MPDKQREPERCPTCTSNSRTDRGCIDPDCGEDQSHRKCTDCVDPWHESAAPVQPAPPSVEDIEFNEKWHLVSANRKSSYGDIYQRPGESAQTANVGAWYDTACYWRRECEKLQAAAPSPVLTQPSAEPSDLVIQGKLWPLKQIIQVCHNILLTELGRKCSITEDKCWICKEVEAFLNNPEAERPVLPVPPSDLLERIGRINEVVEMACTFVQKSDEEGASDLYAFLEGALDNIYDLRQKLARASSPAVAPAERCPSCGSREKAYRLCMIENCGEPHFEETAFSSTHMKAVCSDSWHTAAPAVAGRTQGDELAGFKEWAKSTGDYTSLVNGELVETWVVDDYPIWQAALKWAALRESAREAPEPTEKGT